MSYKILQKLCVQFANFVGVLLARHLSRILRRLRLPIFILPVVCSAQVVTFDISGTMIVSNPYDVFVNGGAFTWTITMDLGASRTGGSVNGSGDGHGDYANAITGLTFNYGNGTFIASQSFASSPLSVRLTNHYTQDYFDFNSPGTSVALTGTTAGGNTIGVHNTFIRLFDITSNAFSSTALVSPVGRNWFTDGNDFAGFTLYDSSGNSLGGFTGIVTSVSATSAIPEPGTYAVVFGGLALIAVGASRVRAAKRKV